MASITSQSKSEQDQSKLNNSSKSNKEKRKREKESKNIERQTKKRSKYDPKAFIVTLNPHTFLIIIISIISLINTQDGTGSTPSFITLKFNGTNETGFVQFLGLDFNYLPNKLYIDDIDQDINNWNTKYVNIIDKTHIVKLQWNNRLPNGLNMFNGLKEVIYIDLSEFDSSAFTSTSYMFANCPNLTRIFFNEFDTSSVISMKGMFENCVFLSYIDLIHFDTSKVTDMSFLFNSCPKLYHVNVSSFNTTSVTTMQNMFSSSGILFLDLSNFNTKKVQNMGQCLVFVAI